MFARATAKVALPAEERERVAQLTFAILDNLSQTRNNGLLPAGSNALLLTR